MSLPITTEVDDEPLEVGLGTTSFPLISEELVNSIALGMEDDLIVAARHGLSVEQYQELAKRPWFALKVAAKRSEFEKEGVTFRAKAAWMASELLDQVYVQAAGRDASLNQKHEVLKTLAKFGNLEPKEDKSASNLPNFSITIDLGDNRPIQMVGMNSVVPQIDTASAQDAKLITSKEQLMPETDTYTLDNVNIDLN